MIMTVSDKALPEDVLWDVAGSIVHSPWTIVGSLRCSVWSMVDSPWTIVGMLADRVGYWLC